MNSKTFRRYWTCYWQNKFWHPAFNRQGESIAGTGGDQLKARGVQAGDMVYIISLDKGRLMLGGSMVVDRIVARDEAMSVLQDEDLWDATWWAVGRPENGSPLDLYRALAPDVSRRLRFIGTEKLPSALKFVSETTLDVQTLRGVRRLTEASAAILDAVIRLPVPERRSRIWTITLSELGIAAPRTAT